jgi:hypothetical protein
VLGKDRASYKVKVSVRFSVNGMGGVRGRASIRVRCRSVVKVMVKVRFR